MPGPLEVTDPAPGSVDWDAAKKYMQGGSEDAQDAGSDDEATGPKEFKYRGKTVKVDADTYSLLEDLKREARGANGRLGSELARTRERLATLEGRLSAGQQTRTEAEPELQPPDPLLATRDIAAWQRQYDAYHTAKMERHQQRLEQAYLGKVHEAEARMTEQRKNNEYAERFYSSYSHLDSPDLKPVVAQVYEQHKAELESLDLDEQHERLAELSEERLARLAQVGKGTPNPNSNGRPPRIESAAGASPRVKQTEKPREFSASRWVAEQRQKMSGRTPKKE